MWNEQYITMKGNICDVLASLRKLTNIIPQKKLCSVYYAIVESELHYPTKIGAVFHKQNSILSNTYRTRPDQYRKAPDIRMIGHMTG